MQHQPRLLGVFAHPDDETFCIGGTLAKYTARGSEALVVSFTRGEAGQIRDARVATRRTLGARREEELRNACKELGVQHVRCLDYSDGMLENVPLDELVGRVVRIIREFQPDVVFSFDRTGGYGHPDHIAISRATTMACRQSGDLAAFPEHLESRLTPHTPTRLYHSYFPRNDRLLLRLLVRWLVSSNTPFRGSDEFIHGLMLFADGSNMLGYAADHLKIEWYPSGLYIIEQGEPGTKLYLILSGDVDILQEDDNGDLRHLNSYGPGMFFGELGIAHKAPRAAHVVANTNVTCLVFAPSEQSLFAGRGEDAHHAFIEEIRNARDNVATTCINVNTFVPAKAAAMAAHRSQYPIAPALFPANLLQELLGLEYFVQIQPTPLPNDELLPGRDVESTATKK
jgi:LmbE family N-acetylglucosaminyl deacetylase